jgi:sterol desaturase/sphingolipid hydroxylase (fatty acid hydroxylase superfamily)
LSLLNKESPANWPGFFVAPAPPPHTLLTLFLKQILAVFAYSLDMENSLWDGVTIITSLLSEVYGRVIIFGMIFTALYVVIKGPRRMLRLSGDAVKGGAHNLGLLLFNTLVMVFVFGGGTFLSNKVYAAYGLPHIPTEAWDALPVWSVWLLVFVLLDFSNFVRHKVLHSKFLWGLHALHHSDEHLTWTTNYRVHVLEVIVSKMVGLALIGALFLPAEIVAVAVLVRSFYSCFVHCQIGLSFGWFDRVLGSPNYHHWHHADIPEAYGKNLALMFPVWDIIFGSYYNPGICREATGVKDAPSGFIGGQLYPLKYAVQALMARLPLKAVSPTKS